MEIEDDSIILQKPINVMSENLLFSCTFFGEYANLHYRFEDLGEDLTKGLNGSLLALNSNFKHSCRPGFEKYLKPAVKQNKKNILVQNIIIFNIIKYK